MSSFVFRGITVELSAEDDHLLTEFSHLVLELKLDDRIGDKVDLVLRESRPGLWDIVKSSTLPEITGHLSFSVFAELGGEERQLLASKELYGPELRDGVGEPVEIVLNGHENHPNMILKTRVVAVDLFRQSSGAERPKNETEVQGNLQDVPINAGDETNGSGHHRTMDSLLQHPRSQTPLDNVGISPSHGLGFPGYNKDIDRRIEREQEAVNSTPNNHPDKFKQLSVFANSLLVHIIPDGHPDKPRRLSNLGNSLLTRFERFGNLDDMNDAIVKHQAAVDLTPDGHPDKPQQLSNLGNSLLTRFDRLGNLDDMKNAIVQHQIAVDLTPDDHPDKPRQLSNLGNSLLTRFDRLGNLDDMNNAIVQHQAAVNLTPDGHPEKPSWLSNLGNSLITRFKRLGNLDDIDNAIARYQAAVNLTPNRDPDKPSLASNLGNSLLTRFQRLGNLDDINNAIVQHQAAVNLTPDGHPLKPSWLNNLGASLLTRFKRLGNLDDINNAIAQQQAAVRLTLPKKPGLLSNLGSSLRTRFDCLGDLNDINNAIVQHQAAVNLTPDGHPEKPIRLSNLGNSLLTRFQRLGDLDDINNAIAQHQAAVNLAPDGHPEKPSRLNNLGNSLITRFERLGNLDDMDNAIARFQTAVNLTPDGHLHKPTLLNNLANSLRTRFKRLGVLDDIDNAIIQNQAAVNLTPDGHPDKPIQLTSLGSSVCIRFKRIGNLDDIDNAIAQHQAAVNLTPDSHPDKSGWLNNLGNSLRTRFEHLQNLDDIDNAIAQHRAAVNLTPDGHPLKPRWVNNLGNSLLTRFQRLGNLGDLDDAIGRHQTAVNLTPDGHPDKSGWLSNLGNSLRTRFDHLENLDDLDNAIAQHQEAVNLTPDGHPGKLSPLNNLGNSLLTRFRRLGNIDDMDSAIVQHQKAVDITPDGHPGKLSPLRNLGSSLLDRFQRLGNPYDAETAIFHLSAASLSPVGSPSIRLFTARRWIHAASITNHSSLLTACESAITIIPLVAWLGLSIQDRHQHLAQIGGVVRDAAAIAISLGQYDKAVEWLERGRSVVWTQILQLRTPVDELRAVEPVLADRLLRVSSLLDQGNQDNKPENEDRQSPEEEARQYRALAKERDELIEKIRSLPKFEDFLRPLKLHRLIEAAKNGPVVVINISEKRCDALALVYGAAGAVHIPLPDLTSDGVTKLQVEFNALLTSSRVRLRAVRDEDPETGGDEGCKRILAQLWDHLVKPVLDSLAFSHDPDTLLRIWWCVTGQLAFLPIHAAGVYDTGESNRQIQDYAISSYTPTISTLLEQTDAPAHKPFRHLSAIEPSSGASYIPNTEKELECIRRRFHNRDHVVLHKADATRERVMNAMKECNWLHLACHGIQDANNPTKSALLLHGGKLTLEEIIRLNLPHAEFAFLSACQTMRGDEYLSDEAVHIAGAMSLAGYRSVVATMWSIEDALAPKVADEFYARLLKDGERPDNRRAAEALHFSVKKLREGEKDMRMLSWLPFVHLGI